MNSPVFKVRQLYHGAAWSGVIPLPLYLSLSAIVIVLAAHGHIPGDLTSMIAVIALGGFTCAAIGKSIPVLNKLGGASLVAAFLPSYLVAHHLLPAVLVQQITLFTNGTQFIYLFIAAVITGSILSMDRRFLISGFFKIVVPLAAGTLAGLAAGGIAGLISGSGFWRSILYLAVPVMSGGIGEGAIPLSVGYSQALNVPQGVMLGTLMPLVFFGNLVAVIVSGALNSLGRRWPLQTGNGQLQPGANVRLAAANALHQDTSPASVVTVAAGGMLAVAVYMLGVLVQKYAALPAPVAMLFAALLLKLSGILPKQLEEGSRVVFRFFVVAVTYPLLFSTAVALTPWDELVRAFHPNNLLIVSATVLALTTTGYYVGRFMGLYPIESALVNACHAGLGGTGSVMILNAAERMELMPFVQIATRIGGALTVTGAILAMAHFHII
jgi:Na+/citrate or Na+/malate symporter